MTGPNNYHRSPFREATGAPALRCPKCGDQLHLSQEQDGAWFCSVCATKFRLPVPPDAAA